MTSGGGLSFKSKDYYPDRVEMINSSLFPHNQKDLRPICELVGKYEYKAPFEELHERVMSKLSIASNEEPLNQFNFYSKEYILKLNSMILKVKERISYNNNFWYDLSRLVFKWILQMKSLFKMDESNEISQSIDSILNITNTNAASILYEIPFNHMNLDFSKRESIPLVIIDLLNCEFIENPEIFSMYDSAIEDFYHNHIGCKGLKEKYFGGDLTSSPLLRAIIITQEPIKKMSLCFENERGNSQETDSSSMMAVKSSFNIKITEANLKTIENKRLEKLKIDEIRFLTSFIINFFLESGRKLEIIIERDLILLLQKLEEANLLSKIAIESLVVFFDDNNKIWKWDQKNFEKYLFDWKNEKKLSDKDYTRYMNLFI